MNHELHQLLWGINIINHIDFFVIYEALFIGYITFVSIIIVAYIYRRSSLLEDLYQIKGDTKNILRMIKSRGDKSKGRIYEPAFLETKELQNKLKENIDDLGKRYYDEVDRVIRLLKKLREIEGDLKRIFKIIIEKYCLIIISISLAAMILHNFLNPVLNLIVVLLLIIYSIIFFWGDFRNFLKAMDLIPQEEVEKDKN